MIFAAIADWADGKEYPVGFMCEQLGVSRSGYYKWRAGGESEHDSYDRLLGTLIDWIWHKFNQPGVRRVRAELAAMGHRVGIARVLRLMQSLGLAGRHRKAYKKTTVQSDSPVPAPDLIRRNFRTAARDQAWCGDITYVRTWQGWAYMATVIDLYSRKLVGWAVADHMRTSLVVDALDQALQNRRPDGKVIFHSDRGSTYTSHDFAEFCENNNVTRCLGRAGSRFDNAVAESFNATYKKELIHTRPWPSVSHVKKGTFDWVETHYNRTRRHSYLGFLTIEEFELGYTQINQLAA